MTKPQVLELGRYDPRRVIYSKDHREWGEDLYYWDIDGIEYAKRDGKMVPVAVIEEHPYGSDVNRAAEHRRYVELAKALSQCHGRDVWPFDVEWSCNPRTCLSCGGAGFVECGYCTETQQSQPVGQRIQRVSVTQIGGDWQADMSREEWIEYLRRLRS